MARTILISLGRLPKGLELARALAGAGCRVIIAEPWRWHLSRVSRSVSRSLTVTPPDASAERYLEDLNAIIREHTVDLVVPVSEEVLHLAAITDSLPQHARLFGMPQAVLLKLHSKLAFMQAARQLDLPVPATYDLTSAEAAEFASRHDYVIKPILSSAGHGVTLHRAGDALPDLDSPAVVQALLPGEEFSSFSIAHQGRLVGTVLYRGLIMTGTVAVCFESIPQPDPEVLAWIRSFVEQTGHSGFISFDFRRDQTGRALPIECNPRTTSGIHFVQPEDLAAAILEPDQPNPFRLRSERVLQQFYPALTETQGAAIKGRPWRGNLRHLFGCRDVSWGRRDPLPFLLMPLTSHQILRRTIFAGMTFGEASTFDIGWYE